jgi:hypothetical protein
MKDLAKQVSFLSGQIAAMETLIQALYVAHPNKEAVQAFYASEIADSAQLLKSAGAAPEMISGFLARSEATGKWLAAGAKIDLPRIHKPSPSRQ